MTSSAMTQASAVTSDSRASSFLASVEEHVDARLRHRVSGRPWKAVLLTAAAGFALGYVLPARLDLIVARKLVWLGLDQILASR